MPSFQNNINSPNPSVWTPFTTAVTAVTTNPTFGSGSTFTSFYLQNGKFLFLNITINNASAGASPGAGLYLLNIPSAFTINMTIAPFSSDLCTGPLGPTVIYSSTFGSGPGMSFTYDSTHYYMMLYKGYQGQTYTYGFYQPGWYDTTNPSVLSANLTIPIN